MNWIDAVFVLVLAGLAFAGHRKGIIHVIVIIASYAAGVIAAVALSEAAAELISGYTQIPQGISRILASVAVFLIAALAVRGIGWLLKKAVALALPGIDRICGMIFGIVLALIIIILCSVFLSYSPPSSSAGRLYEESFSPRFVISGIERLYTAPAEEGAEEF